MTNSKAPEDLNLKGGVRIDSEKESFKRSLKELEDEKRTERMKTIMMNYHSNDPDAKQSAIEQMTLEIGGFLGYMIQKNFKAFAPEHYRDLYNEGVIAVIETMSKYNPEVSTATTYFTYPVLHAMSTYVNSITNKSSAYYAAIMNKIRSAINYFEAEERNWTITDLAYHTGLSVKKVEEGLKRINAVNEYRYENDAELDAVLNEQAKNPEEQLIEQEQEQMIKEALQRLSQEDREIIMYRFGFDDGKQKSFSKIAKLVGMPINQVSASISRSLRKLRESPELAEFQNVEARKKREAVLDDMKIVLAPKDIVNIYAELGQDNEAVIKVSFESDTGKDVEPPESDKVFIKF